MAKLNENDLAKYVVLRAGGKQSISIGQVKEVIKLTLDRLASLSRGGGMASIVALVEKHK